MYKEKFENILGENEEIIRIEKAKKATFALKKVTSIILSICIVLGIFYFSIFIFSTQISLDYNPVWIRNLAIIIFAFILLDIVFFMKYYSMCLTNKRIIIRYGAFTNNFSQYSIDNVTGNIQTLCTQSIWDKKDGKDASGYVSANIELYPVWHGRIHVVTSYSIENSYEMAKAIERVVKNNAKNAEITTKE